MNLKSKILLIIIGFLALQGGIFFAYYYFSLIPKVEALEQSLAEKNAQRSRNMITRELDDLESLTALWSSQKALKHLMQTNQVPQLNLLFSQERIQEKGLHVFYLLDQNMRPVLNTTLDPKNNQSILMVNFLNKLSKMRPSFFDAKQDQTLLSGVFISDRGPLFMSAHKIMSDTNQPLGWIIVGRHITQNMIDTFNKQMRIDLSIYPSGSKNLSEKMSNLIPVIQANPNLIHTENSTENLKVYSHMHDISGNKSIILLSITPKQTASLIKQSMTQSYGVLLSVNFILVMLLLKILNHAIIKPTRKITDLIVNATQNVDAPPRIKSNRKDELGLLTYHLNDMISEFCRFRTKSMSDAYKNGSEKFKQDMLDDLDSAFKEIIPLIETHEKRLWSTSLNALEKLQAELSFSKPEDVNWDVLKQDINNSNYYLSHEIQDYRRQVRKIKDKILRTATICKSHLLHIDNNKPYTIKQKEDHYRITPTRMNDINYNDN